MNSNRAVNEDVVRHRVRANRDALARTGRYCDFGQIVMLIVRTSPARNFLVMDGQHRCVTMDRLYALDQASPILFQFRAKVVANEAEAYAELTHFQDCYPADPRAFYPTQRMTRLANAVVGRVKARWPGAFKAVSVPSRRFAHFWFALGGLVHGIFKSPNALQLAFLQP